MICHPVDVSFVGKMKKVYQRTILDKKAVQKNGIIKEKMKWFSEGGEAGV